MQLDHVAECVHGLTDWVDDAPRRRVWVYHAAWLTALGLVIGPNVVASGVIAGGIYVVSLYRLHGLLVTEKRKLIGIANENTRILSGRVHAAVASNDLTEIEALSEGLAAVQTELAVLERASTWPRHPELSRITVTALLVPALLWVLQRLLQGWL